MNNDINVASGFTICVGGMGFRASSPHQTCSVWFIENAMLIRRRNCSVNLHLGPRPHKVNGKPLISKTHRKLARSCLTTITAKLNRFLICFRPVTWFQYKLSSALSSYYTTPHVLPNASALFVGRLLKWKRRAIRSVGAPIYKYRIWTMCTI